MSVVPKMPRSSQKVIDRALHSKKSLKTTITGRVRRSKQRNSDHPNSAFDWIAHLTSVGSDKLFRKMKGQLRRTLSQSRRGLYEDLRIALEVGRWLEANPAQFEKFRLLDEWGTVGQPPKPSDLKEAWRSVTRWSCGLDNEGNKNASFYNGALSAFAASGDDPAGLVSYIEFHGGLNALYRRNASLKNKPFDQEDDPVFGGQTGTNVLKRSGAASQVNPATIHKTGRGAAGKPKKVQEGKAADLISPKDEKSDALGYLLIELSTEGHTGKVKSLHDGSRARLDVEILHIEGDSATMNLDRIRIL